ncbi:MAG: SgcJ/EcaC family oxidoreductase [Anaerolineaceae bacterium]|nr:SgcJ/EcaC family oxidoreductase [Anaerolineaceae bacterium]
MDEEREVVSLYRRLLGAWNRQSAGDMAALFDVDGYIVGFDGSQHIGAENIESEVGSIFADHVTARYVAKVRDVRLLTPEVAVLRAVAGMAPPGQSDLNPAVNVVHTLVAVKRGGQWRIAVYQNTPAAYHGRPNLRDELTEELRQVLRSEGTAA